MTNRSRQTQCCTPLFFSVAEALQLHAIVERDPDILSTLEVATRSPGSWAGRTVLDHVRHATRGKSIEFSCTQR